MIINLKPLEFVSAEYLAKGISFLFLEITLSKGSVISTSRGEANQKAVSLFP